MRTAKAIDPSSRTLLVEVDVPNHKGKLLPGAYTEVHMTVHDEIANMVIPVSALIFRGHGLQVGTVVKGANGDVAKLVQIGIGQDDGITVQVNTGLTADSQVIQNPPDSLIDGEPVHVVQPSNDRGQTERIPGCAGMKLRNTHHDQVVRIGIFLATVAAFRLHRWAQLPSSRLRLPRPYSKRSPYPLQTRLGGGWKQVAPNDSAMRANWWEIYQDPQLDKLEQQVAVSNQTLKASYEQYMQARATIQYYRSQYYPTVQAGPSATRDRQSQNRPLYVPGSKSTYNDIFLQGQVAWEPDLWGNIRRAVESQRATAQATAADLANVDLSLRSELATDYFELRGLDTQQRLLDNTVEQYQQYLTLTKVRFAGGVATESDVALAQTQVDQTRAQAIDVGVARAQYEHAIATLTGIPASSFGLPRRPSTCSCPRYRLACRLNCWNGVLTSPPPNAVRMRQMPRSGLRLRPITPPSTSPVPVGLKARSADYLDPRAEFPLVARRLGG